VAIAISLIPIYTSFSKQFNHINRLSFSFFDEARTEDLMSRVTNDVVVLNQFFGQAAMIILTHIIILIGILVILFR